MKTSNRVRENGGGDRDPASTSKAACTNVLEEEAEKPVYPNPLSPVKVALLDKDRKVMGYVFYHLDSDKGRLLQFDYEVNYYYREWPLAGEPLVPVEGSYYHCQTVKKKHVPPRSPCLNLNCLCNIGTVRRVPYAWAQGRQDLISEGKHWLKEIEVVPLDSPLFSDYILEIKNIKINDIKDSGEKWKAEWNAIERTNPSFLKLKEIEDCRKRKNHDPDHVEVEVTSNGTDFVRLEQLPIVVYKVLLKNLSPLVMMNLLLTSSAVEDQIWQCLNHFYTSAELEQRFFRYCIEGLDRSTVLKIIASYDTRIRPRASRIKRDDDITDEIVNHLTWAEIFRAYGSYWTSLTKEGGIPQRMRKLEQKVRDHALFHRQATLEAFPKADEMVNTRVIHSLGGRALFYAQFPAPVNPVPQNKWNVLLIEDFNEVKVRHAAHLCTAAPRNSNFQLRVAHIPIAREGHGPEAIPEVERVITTLCHKCLCTTPMSGGTGITKQMTLHPNDEEELVRQVEPIFEVKDNVIVVWDRPDHLVFYLLVPVGEPPNHAEGYRLLTLYRLRFPQMEDVWNRVAMYRSYYLPVITEHKGETEMLYRAARAALAEGQTGYLYQAKEPVYYGLSLVSPIYGVESFKPSKAPDEACTIVESLEHQVYLQNGRKYLKEFRRPPFYSAQGHGNYVFCTNTAIAISWDCITWLFGRLRLPSAELGCRGRTIRKVEVISSNGLMVVLSDHIILYEFTVKTAESKNPQEPELIMEPLRILVLNLPLKYELGSVELNFDKGNPFLLVVAWPKPLTVKLKSKDKKEEGTEFERTFQNQFQLMVTRLDFIPPQLE